MEKDKDSGYNKNKVFEESEYLNFDFMVCKKCTPENIKKGHKCKCLQSLNRNDTFKFDKYK